MSHVKAMAGGLIKLRVRGKKEVRLFHTFLIGKRVYLLLAFTKTTKINLKKELNIASQRKIEIEKRNI